MSKLKLSRISPKNKKQLSFRSAFNQSLNQVTFGPQRDQTISVTKRNDRFLKIFRTHMNTGLALDYRGDSSAKPKLEKSDISLPHNFQWPDTIYTVYYITTYWPFWI